MTFVFVFIYLFGRGWGIETTRRTLSPRSDSAPLLPPHLPSLWCYHPVALHPPAPPPVCEPRASLSGNVTFPVRGKK
ncbi:hypothetical protein XENTR_v10015297 [Xenopus tropicalis]|nr:hypothetical protein XENTR_v10015297 [Xenopus tropicalis]